MERIQSAIEKARKERAQNDEIPATKPAPARKKPAAKTKSEAEITVTQPSVEDAWKALRSFHPKPRRLKHKRILAYQSCPEAAAYDMMRTKLLQLLRQNDWRRVAITSHEAGCGKTMTCLNLAFSLARQNDLKVMVLELDMRRPSMVNVLGVTDRIQFSQSLTGKEPPEKNIVRYGTNLAFAVNQTSARHTAEMLQGAKAGKIVDEIEATYAPDVMIFDTPPLMASDDTLAFLDQVDCALLIAEAENTTVAEVDKCEQELAARTNVLGVTLNKCRYLDRSESYGHYYGQ